jgi:hypothetical protein
MFSPTHRMNKVEKFNDNDKNELPLNQNIFSKSQSIYNTKKRL